MHNLFFEPRLNIFRARSKTVISIHESAVLEADLSKCLISASRHFNYATSRPIPVSPPFLFFLSLPNENSNLPIKSSHSQILFTRPQIPEYHLPSHSPLFSSLTEIPNIPRNIQLPTPIRLAFPLPTLDYSMMELPKCAIALSQPKEEPIGREPKAFLTHHLDKLISINPPSPATA